MSSIIDVIIYLILLLWTLVNVKRYLIDQQRYKTFSILIFYVLAISTELSRLIMYFNQIFLEWKGDVWNGFFGRAYLYDFFYVIALFCMANLGFYQVQNMIELSIRLTETNNSKPIERKLMILNMTIRIVVVLSFICMVCLASYFMVVLRQLYKYCYFDT